MMLRRLCMFCLTLSLFCYAPISHAQKGKSEVSFAYGYYSAYSLANRAPYSASTGVGMLNYKYYLMNKLTLGMNFGYENISDKGSYLTFAPEFTYTYLDTKNDRIRVRLYGGASLGITIFDDFVRYRDIYSNHYDQSGPQVTGNITPFGMRIGRKLSWFIEVGLGYKGLFNSGISYRFRTKKSVHTEK